MISFQHVHKYLGDLHVLDDITFKIETGEVVVICGPSGSGKSTLLRCINGLESIGSGDIVVNGTPVTDRMRDIAKLRAEVGMVFQQFNLYPHLRVIDNITLAPERCVVSPKSEAMAIAHELLAKSAFRTRRCPFPRSFQAGSGSAWQSPGHSPCGRRSCCSTSRHQRSTRR